MQELILGTVQLGLPYGINNKQGKPSHEEAFKILEYAYNNGVRMLDTASGYGESEKIIGEYIKQEKNEFGITTKLSKLEYNEDIKAFVNKQIDNSLNLLGKECIEIYLLHNFEDLKKTNGLMDELVRLKYENKIKKIGVSLYEPSELEYILLNYSDEMDVVQIPFNLFDYRWLENDLLKRTEEKSVQIFVRSVFLQGLFFLEDEMQMNAIDHSLKDYLIAIKQIAREMNISIEQLALSYVKSFSEIKGILVGCENVNQLKGNIQLFRSNITIRDTDKRKIFKLTQGISSKIIDPRQWNR